MLPSHRRDDVESRIPPRAIVDGGGDAAENAAGPSPARPRRRGFFPLVAVSALLLFFVAVAVSGEERTATAGATDLRDRLSLAISGAIAALSVEDYGGAKSALNQLRDEFMDLREFVIPACTAVGSAAKSAAATAESWGASLASEGAENARRLWTSFAEATEGVGTQKKKRDSSSSQQLAKFIGGLRSRRDGKQQQQPQRDRDQKRKERATRKENRHQNRREKSEEEVAPEELLNDAAGGAEPPSSPLDIRAILPLLAAASGIVYLLASFVAGRRDRSITLDDREAEIVEFYEKEMEAGTHFALEGGGHLRLDLDLDELPKGGGVGVHDDDENDAESSQPRSCLEIISRPSTSGSRGRRGSRRDSYYAMVLRDMETYDYDDHCEVERRREESGECYHQEECKNEAYVRGPQGGPEERILSTQAPEGDQETRPREIPLYEPYRVEPLSPLTAKEEEDRNKNDGVFDPSSPGSSPSSSISSITMDRMDVESQSPHPSPSLPSQLHLKESASTLLPSAGTSTWANSPRADTFLQKRRENAFNNSNDHAAIENGLNIAPPTAVVRHVSFEKMDCEVPPFLFPAAQSPRRTYGAATPARAEPRRMSPSEKYLYAMLVVVGIAIALVSLVPALPSTSSSSLMTWTRVASREVADSTAWTTPLSLGFEF